MGISKILIRLFVMLATVLVVLPCLQQGMFLDGVNYANVANNLANGKGTIWHFTYSDTFLSHYTHQLPLMLWCEGFFFYLFGEDLLVERVFCLVLFLLNSHALAALWQESFPDHKQYYGWPLLLWVATPIVFWGFANNVQELMMSLCSLWSVIYLLRYFRSGLIWQILLAGGFCFLSGFCKGVQGLFPLAAIVLYHLCVEARSIKSVITDQLLFSMPLVVLSGLLWSYSPSRQMLIDNFDSRLKSTFANQDQDTTSFRFDLWVDLVAELLVPIAACMVLLSISKFVYKKVDLNWNRKSLFLCLIGLSASLPLIVTLEQRRFYLVTSIGFFVVAIAGVFVRMLYSVKVKKNVRQIGNGILTVGSMFALVFALANTGTFKRDKQMLKDVDAIGTIVPEQTISADEDLVFHYPLIAYLARKHNVSLDFDNQGSHNYHLTVKGRKREGEQVVDGNIYLLLKSK